MRRALIAIALMILATPTQAAMNCASGAKYAEYVAWLRDLGKPPAVPLQEIKDVYEAIGYPGVEYMPPIVRDVYEHPQFDGRQMAARTFILCQRAAADYLTR